MTSRLRALSEEYRALAARLREGGGAYDDTTQGTPLRAYDSIIGQNTAPLGPDARGTIELNNTVAGAGTGVGPLLDMGGPTRVRPLLKGSPALDLFTPPPSDNPDDRRDQRGSPRPYNTNEDCGAYEDGPAEAELLFAAAKTGSVNHVITTSGLYGTISALDDETVTLLVAPGVEMKYDRRAVGRILDDDQPGGERGGPPA